MTPCPPEADHEVLVNGYPATVLVGVAVSDRRTSATGDPDGLLTDGAVEIR